MSSQYLRDGNGQLIGPTLQEAVFNGTVDPGDIVAVREVVSDPNPGDIDTAVFSDVRANYNVSTVGGVTTVTHLVPAGGDGGGGGGGGGLPADGTDVLRNVERLVFADTVVPNAPVIGPATGGNASATGNWAVNGADTATQFQVRVLDATGNQVGALRPAPAGARSLVVSGLTNGQSYRFQVRAVNAVGPGAFSALSNTVTPTAPTAAGAPTIGTATAGNASATVRWNPPAGNGGSPITGYQVRVVNSATNAQVGALRSTGPATTNLVVTGLTNGTGYRFQVRAVNGVGPGAYSALSNTVTPATVPGPPVIGTASPGVTGGALTATARWSPPASNGGSAITGYVATALRTSATGTVLTRTDSPLLGAAARARTFTLPAGNYRFVLRARNAVGQGQLSARSNLVAAR